MKVWLRSHTLTRIARATSVHSALIGLTTFALITPLTSTCFGQFAVVDETSEKGHSILVREGEQLDAVEPHQSGSKPKPYKMLQQTPDKGTAQAHGTHVAASDAVGGGFISSSSQSDQVDRHDSQTTGLSSNGLRGASAGKLRPADSSAAQTLKFTAQAAPAFSVRPARAPQSKKEISPLPTQRRTSPPQQVRTKSDVIVDRSVAPASYAAPVQSFQNQSRGSLQSLQPRQNAGQGNRYNSFGNQSAQNTQQRQGNRSQQKSSSSAKVSVSYTHLTLPTNREV